MVLVKAQGSKQTENLVKFPQELTALHLFSVTLVKSLESASSVLNLSTNDKSHLKSNLQCLPLFRWTDSPPLSISA